MTDDIDKRLDEMTGQLPRDVQPERDLWPDIAVALDRESTADARPRFETPPLWQRYLAQAAAVVVLVGGSSAMTYVAVKSDRSTLSPVAPVTLNAEMANFGGQHTLGPGFQDARRDLQGRLDFELDRLSPEARAEVQANIDAIHAAIDEINTALVNEPNNALLQELLLSSYQEELALMRKVNGITRSVMLREDI